MLENTGGYLEIWKALQQVYGSALVGIQGEGVKPLKILGLFTTGVQINS